jgi:hypothetical protein
MESTGLAGHVHISEATYNLLPEAESSPWICQGQMDVKVNQLYARSFVAILHCWSLGQAVTVSAIQEESSLKGTSYHVYFVAHGCTIEASIGKRIPYSPCNILTIQFHDLHEMFRSRIA